MSFVLGSSSESRISLLKKMGFNPEFTASPNINEDHLKNEDVRIYAKRMSETKAKAVAEIHPDKVILSADTVAAKGKRILPKALIDEEVREILIALSGRRHRVYTSVSLIIPNEKIKTKIVVTSVKFKRLTPTEIEGYILSKEGLGKAGGYSIQGRANLFIHEIIGSFTNVIGLPMYEVACLLQSANVYTDWKI